MSLAAMIYYSGITPKCAGDGAENVTRFCKGQVWIFNPRALEEYRCDCLYEPSLILCFTEEKAMSKLNTFGKKNFWDAVELLSVMLTEMFVTFAFAYAEYMGEWCF